MTKSPPRPRSAAGGRPGGRCERARPAPTDPGDVRDLTTRLTEAEPDPQLLPALEQAGGNLLYVRERVAAVADRPPGDLDRPAALTAAIGRRLGALGSGTLDVLRLAMLGRDFDVLELAMTTGGPRPT